MLFSTEEMSFNIGAEAIVSYDFNAFLKNREWHDAKLGRFALFSNRLMPLSSVK